jgi:glutathione S-transferase
LMYEMIEVDEKLKEIFEIKPINIFKQEHKTDWFKKYNPQGKIPILIDGENSIFESGAILVYLSEKYSNLNFKSKNLGNYYQWIFFATSELDRHLILLQTELIGKKYFLNPIIDYLKWEILMTIWFNLQKNHYH